MAVSERHLAVVDELLWYAARKVAKNETARSRKDRDRKQARYLDEWIDDLRRYFVEFAERIGIEIDTTLPPRESAPQMVNPERDARNYRVTKQNVSDIPTSASLVAKRKTFVGLPTRAPFDLPIDWRNEADELGKVMSKHHDRWLNFGTNISLNDMQAVGVDLDSVTGLAGSLQLGDYETGIRSSLANRIVRVSEVQRTVVRDTVQRGIEAGLSTKEIANGARINGRVYPGIKGRVEQMYRNRSRVIALTESANAYNLGQLEGYKRSGVVDKVRIFDGSDCGWTSHDDPDKANGSVRTLAQAQAQPTSHPNCQRSWAPVPLAQTRGTGATRSPKTGQPRTSSPTPPTGTPKTQSPNLPTPSGPDRVGRAGTRWHDATAKETFDHLAPDGFQFSQLDDATWGLVDDTGAFRQGVTIDKAAQQRARDIFRERYGISEVNFDAVTKSKFAYEDVQGTMLAFEDYRKLGVGFDDLVVSFTKKKGNGALAHFDTSAGLSGEVQFHQSLVRQARRPARLRDGNYTGFRSTAQHELGHALDDRVMGGAAGRGGNYVEGWARSTADRDFLARWKELRRQSRVVGSQDDAATKLRQARENIVKLDDEIARRQAKIAADDFADDIDRQLNARSLNSNKFSRNQWKKLERDLDAQLSGTGGEPFPTNYAKSGGSVEDFADTARSYLQNPERFRRAYPQRAAYFDDALERGRLLPKNYADDVGIPARNQAYKDYVAARKARQAARRQARQSRGYEKPPERPSLARDAMSRDLTPEADFMKPGRVVNIHDPYYRQATKGLPTSSKPQVRMTGGGPASGKSKALIERKEVGIPGKGKSAHIDPDGAKAAIPEYQELVAAGDKRAAAIMHEESSHMAKTSVNRALKDGHDVVYDSVGDSGIDKLHAKVGKFRAAGAETVEADYVTIPVEEALKREAKRAIRTKRKVDESVVRAGHADITNTVLGAIERGTFERLTLWSNDVPIGSAPTKIATYVKGRGLAVHDPAAWRTFVSQGA